MATRSAGLLLHRTTADGVTLRDNAARSKLPSRTTAANARKFPWSIFIGLEILNIVKEN